MAEHNEIDTLEEAVFSRGWLMGMIVGFGGLIILTLIVLWALGYLSSEGLALVFGLFSAGYGTKAGVEKARK